MDEESCILLILNIHLIKQRLFRRALATCLCVWEQGRFKKV